MYQTSLYWTVTTLTTVGYGDISGVNSVERLICIVTMLFGVSFFAYANGAFAAMITNIDEDTALYEKNLEQLNQIYTNYHIPYGLFK